MKTIRDVKPGEKVIYVGGVEKYYNRVVKEDKSFTLGKVYISDTGYDLSDYNDVFYGIQGRIGIQKDDSGDSNGWGAALFEPYEESKDTWQWLCQDPAGKFYCTDFFETEKRMNERITPTKIIEKLEASKRLKKS